MYSIFYYQNKIEKKDFSKFDFSKFIQSFNFILEDLTSGRFINVSKSKKHDIDYKKFQFIHQFITSEHNDIHDSLIIKFKPFDDNYNDDKNYFSILDDDDVEN